VDVTPLKQRFILHLGEMGSRWGINRTVGQIYALLFVSNQPLNADDIVMALGLSRSNVSMGLKELKSWRLIQAASVPGDRREYWTTSKDVWELFRVLAEERRRREVDPTLTMLRETLMTEPVSYNDRYAQDRIREMHDLIEMLNTWADEMEGLPPKTLMRLFTLGQKIQKLLDPRRKQKKSSPTDRT